MSALRRSKRKTDHCGNLRAVNLNEEENDNHSRSEGYKLRSNQSQNDELSDLEEFSAEQLHEVAPLVDLPGSMWGVHRKPGGKTAFVHINEDMVIDKTVEFTTSCVPIVKVNSSSINLPEVKSKSHLECLLRGVDAIVPGEQSQQFENRITRKRASLFKEAEVRRSKRMAILYSKSAKKLNRKSNIKENKSFRMQFRNSDKREELSKSNRIEPTKEDKNELSKLEKTEIPKSDQTKSDDRESPKKTKFVFKLDKDEATPQRKKENISSVVSCCVVETCKNNFLKTKAAGLNISYYRFPTDEKLLKKWKEKCKVDDSKSLKSARVCSEHFKNEDFDGAVTPGSSMAKRCLKSKAVPSLYLTEEKLSMFLNKRSSERQLRQKNLENKENRKIQEREENLDNSKKMIENNKSDGKKMITKMNVNKPSDNDKTMAFVNKQLIFVHDRKNKSPEHQIVTPLNREDSPVIVSPHIETIELSDSESSEESDAFEEVVQVRIVPLNSSSSEESDSEESAKRRRRAMKRNCKAKVEESGNYEIETLEITLDSNDDSDLEMNELKKSINSHLTPLITQFNPKMTTFQETKNVNPNNNLSSLKGGTRIDISKLSQLGPTLPIKSKFSSAKINQNQSPKLLLIPPVRENSFNLENSNTKFNKEPMKIMPQAINTNNEIHQKKNFIKISTHSPVKIDNVNNKLQASNDKIVIPLKENIKDQQIERQNPKISDIRTEEKKKENESSSLTTLLMLKDKLPDKDTVMKIVEHKISENYKILNSKPDLNKSRAEYRKALNFDPHLCKSGKTYTVIPSKKTSKAGNEVNTKYQTISIPPGNLIENQELKEKDDTEKTGIFNSKSIVSEPKKIPSASTLCKKENLPNNITFSENEFFKNESPTINFSAQDETQNVDLFNAKEINSNPHNSLVSNHCKNNYETNLKSIPSVVPKYSRNKQNILKQQLVTSKTEKKGIMNSVKISTNKFGKPEDINKMPNEPINIFPDQHRLIDYSQKEPPKTVKKIFTEPVKSSTESIKMSSKLDNEVFRESVKIIPKAVKRSADHLETSETKPFMKSRQLYIRKSSPENLNRINENLFATTEFTSLTNKKFSIKTDVLKDLPDLFEENQKDMVEKTSLDHSIDKEQEGKTKVENTEQFNENNFEENIEDVSPQERENVEQIEFVSSDDIIIEGTLDEINEHSFIETNNSHGLRIIYNKNEENINFSSMDVDDGENQILIVCKEGEDDQFQESDNQMLLEMVETVTSQSDKVMKEHGYSLDSGNGNLINLPLSGHHHYFSHDDTKSFGQNKFLNENSPELLTSSLKTDKLTEEENKSESTAVTIKSSAEHQQHMHSYSLSKCEEKRVIFSNNKKMILNENTNNPIHLEAKIEVPTKGQVEEQNAMIDLAKEESFEESKVGKALLETLFSVNCPTGNIFDQNDEMVKQAEIHDLLGMVQVQPTSSDDPSQYSNPKVLVLNNLQVSDADVHWGYGTEVDAGKSNSQSDLYYISHSDREGEASNVKEQTFGENNEFLSMECLEVEIVNNSEETEEGTKYRRINFK